LTIGSDPRPVGILGGTFDPVHYGHLRPALEVLENLGLAEIRFIPCRQPSHRGQPVASPAQRLALLQCAVAGQPGFVVDERELQRAGPSYMVDTLTSLRAERGTTPLCLLLGTDAFAQLTTWHRWQALADLAHLIVLQRPGSLPPTAPPLLEWLAQRQPHDPAALRTQPAGMILLHAVTQLDISATRIRALLAHGQSPRYLLPEAVCAAIHEQGLYRPATPTNLP
jgi:nicotinate-nucleotide adenylyltransferase